LPLNGDVDLLTASELHADPAKLHVINLSFGINCSLFSHSFYAPPMVPALHKRCVCKGAVDNTGRC